MSDEAVIVTYLGIALFMFAFILVLDEDENIKLTTWAALLWPLTTIFLLGAYFASVIKRRL